MEIIVSIFILTACVVLPFVITGLDIYYLFVPYDSLLKAAPVNEKQLPFTKRILTKCRSRKTRRLNYFMAAAFGGFCQLVWENLFVGISGKSWQAPLVVGGADEAYHEYISEEFGTWYWILLTASVITTLVMNFCYDKREPPLISSLMTGMSVSGIILSALYIIQLWGQINDKISIAVLFVLPVNYMMISARSCADEIACVLKNFEADGNIPESGLNGVIYRLLKKTSGKIGFVFLSLIPALAVLAMILLLTGQGADALTKAFTMTADWTFSTQTPPPPTYYEGHYLCTVAAGGHRRLVRPLRMGTRAGDRIIVNRQLCIANAFEDLIMDKTPRFHRALRGYYDKYGYPLCRSITTPLRADIVYIIMKPLEWLFLIVLYLFDTKPESRISAQYTGRKYKSCDL